MIKLILKSLALACILIFLAVTLGRSKKERIIWIVVTILIVAAVVFLVYDQYI